MDELQQLLLHITQLEAEGNSHTAAFERARLERKIASWPETMGDDLVVWLYGGLEIHQDVNLPRLGIRISSQKTTRGFSFGTADAFECRISVSTKDLNGVMDGIHRLEKFMNAWNLIAWGRPIHYSCMFFPIDAILTTNLTEELVGIEHTLNVLDGFTKKQQAIISRALWWLRQCQSSTFYGSGEASPFNVYMAYWNAFECLVSVICDICPSKKASSADKLKDVANYFKNISGDPTPDQIQKCYRQYIDAGFKPKADHTLKIVYGKVSQQYYDECFTQKPDEQRLYQIRNDIDHGNIVEYSLEDRLRVETGVGRLWHIVFNTLHILLGRGIIHDSTLKVCHTCSNCTELYQCNLKLKPDDELYWKFFCDSYERK